MKAAEIVHSIAERNMLGQKCVNLSKSQGFRRLTTLNALGGKKGFWISLYI